MPTNKARNFLTIDLLSSSPPPEPATEPALKPIHANRLPKPENLYDQDVEELDLSTEDPKPHAKNRTMKRKSLSSEQLPPAAKRTTAGSSRAMGWGGALGVSLEKGKLRDGQEKKQRRKVKRSPELIDLESGISGDADTENTDMSYSDGNGEDDDDDDEEPELPRCKTATVSSLQVLSDPPSNSPAPSHRSDSEHSDTDPDLSPRSHLSDSEHSDTDPDLPPRSHLSDSDHSDTDPDLPPRSHTRKRLPNTFTNGPSMPRNPLSSLIDSIPLEHRGLVGRRRLIKKKQFDGSDEDDDKLTREEQIVMDTVQIEKAAKRVGCKRVWVKGTKREEVDESEVMKGGVVKGGVVKGGGSGGEGKGKEEGDAGMKDLLALLDDDDEEMVLRRPSEKRKGKATEEGINDDMEWIQGGDLGVRDKGRTFRDVATQKLRWRVPGMHTPLLDHQVLGVDWMVDHEMAEKQPRGGLVADAMGLGKTIQSIATMVLNPAPPAEKATDPMVTLIVAPVALLQQWKEEIKQHAKRGCFAVHIHHGKDKVQTVKALRRKDVVITSYGAVMSSYPSTKKPKRMTEEEQEIWWNERWQTRGIFHRIKFWRVILDEAHVIKNRYSRTSLACQELDAIHTWALTGTPIQNSLNDIYPIFRFIRHPHLSMWEGFKDITAGSEYNYEPAAKRIQAVLRGCMMRRNKKDMLLGKELMELPKKRVRMVELEFSTEERSLYRCVEAKSRNTMNKYIKQGTVMKNYSEILVMLMRLRQICDHPYLILQTINNDFTVDDINQAIAPTPTENFNNPSALRQLLAAAHVIARGDTTECSICLDSPEGPIITKCRHVFCRDCIISAITKAARSGNLNPSSCPLCKREIHIDDLTPYTPDCDSDTDSELEAILNPKNKDPEEEDWLKVEFTHSAKTKALRDQLLEWRENHPGDKVVLFSQFVKMLDLVEKVIIEEGWGCVRYQGSMNMDDREESLRTFRYDPDCTIMLTSLRAGGVGLNLTHANLVLSLDLWWNAAVELQAFDRVHRMGQEKEVYVSRFIVKGTVEQRILALQRKKQGIANAALGDGKGCALGRLTERELVGLFGSVEGEGRRMRVVAEEERGRPAVPPVEDRYRR